MADETQGPETPTSGFKGKGIGVNENAIAFRPKNWEELWNFASLVAKTDFVPKGMRDNPGAVLAAIQTGHELGVGPMASLQNITPISGRPVIWGDLALALLKASPEFEWIQERPPHETVAQGGGECIVKMHGEEPLTRQFTMEMAKQAGLLNKEGPWQTYTGRQYQMRARAWAIRDAAPGVLRGIGIREEIQDIEIEATVEREAPIALPKPKETKATNGQSNADQSKGGGLQESTGESSSKAKAPQTESPQKEAESPRQGEAKDGKAKSKAKPAEVKNDPPKEDEPTISLKNQLLAWISTCSYEQLQSFDKEKSRVANEVMGIRDPMERQEVLTAWDLERRTRPEPRQPGKTDA